jgi:hypothetical protein
MQFQFLHSLFLVTFILPPTLRLVTAYVALPLVGWPMRRLSMGTQCGDERSCVDEGQAVPKREMACPRSALYLMC